MLTINTAPKFPTNLSSVYLSPAALTNTLTQTVLSIVELLYLEQNLNKIHLQRRTQTTQQQRFTPLHNCAVSIARVAT